MEREDEIGMDTHTHTHHMQDTKTKTHTREADATQRGQRSIYTKMNKTDTCHKLPVKRGCVGVWGEITGSDIRNGENNGEA